MNSKILIALIVMFISQIQTNASKDKHHLDEPTPKSRNVRRKSTDSSHKKSGIKQTNVHFGNELLGTNQREYHPEQRSDVSGQIAQFEALNLDLNYDFSNREYNIGSSSKNKELLNFNTYGLGLDDTILNPGYLKNMATGASSSDPNFQQEYWNYHQVTPCPQYEQNDLDFVNEILDVGEPYAHDDTQQLNDQTQHKLISGNEQVPCKECCRRLHLQFVNTKCDICCLYLCQPCFQKLHTPQTTPIPKEIPDEDQEICRFCYEHVPSDANILLTHPCGDRTADSKLYKCCVCNYIDKKKLNMLKHLRTHTREKPFPCPKCKFAAKDKSNLYKHIRIAHKEIPCEVKKRKTKPTASS